jgi:glucose dehydrogenase
VALRFRPLATLTALLFFALSAVLMFQPSAILGHWGVGFDASTGLVSRRAAALYAGVGLMLFLARKAEHSPARSALVSGFVFICVILAVLGVFEVASGHASVGILPAVLAEVALAIIYLLVARAEGATRTHLNFVPKT